MRKLLCSSLALFSLTTACFATETENHGIQVLPAPGKVSIDGKFDDWDLTGGVFACGDAETQRDTYAVWFHAMYDKDNLYLLTRWNDPTPLNNPGSTLGDLGWNGDALQVRVILHPDSPTRLINNLTCWKGHDGADVVQLESKITGHGPGGIDIKPQGAKQAFAVNPDGSGYVQEVSIPWKLLSEDGTTPGAGDKIVLTIEPNFTVGSGGRLSIKDIFRPGKAIDRVFTFQNNTIWGVASLETKGNVSPRPVRLSDSREFPVQMKEGLPVVDWKGLVKSDEVAGVKEIQFNMPGDGFVSLNILDGNGFPVRHLLNQAEYSKGAHTVKWDGLKDGWYHAPGELAAEGKYSFSAIYHPALHMTLNGWASNDGPAPWDNGPASNWGGDMGPPDAAATDGAFMYLGWSSSEAGKAVVATDVNGNVRWRHKRGGFGGAQFIAAEDGAVYVVDGDVIYVINASDGNFKSWAGTATGEVHIASLWPDRTDMPSRVSGLDVRHGVAYLSFGHADFRRTDVTDWKALIAHIRDGASRGDALSAALWNALSAQHQAALEKALSSKDPEAIAKQVAAINELARQIAAQDQVAIQKAYGEWIKHAKGNFIAGVDLATGKVTKMFDADAPARLRAASDGAVYFLSAGSNVCKLDPATGRIATIVSGLENASGIAVGIDGVIYVGVRDPDNQIKAYDASGKLLRTIGRKGGRPLLGPWKSDGIAFVAGMTLDPKGHLWVAEEDATPRRFSVWDPAAGTLIHEYFGPTHYGASGGAIYPQDPNVLVGEACEWRIDPATGHARCLGVIDRKSGGMFGGHSFARFAKGANGRDYLMTLSAGGSAEILQMFERLGDGNYALRTTVTVDGAAKTTTFWSDENGDGQIQPNETATFPMKMSFGGYYDWSLYANTDLTLYPGIGTGSAQLKIAGFSTCGAPKYDLSKIKILQFEPGMPSPDNKTVLSMAGRSTGWRYAAELHDVASGRLLWSYPAEFFGVHGSHDAPPPQTGLIRGAFGVVGSGNIPGAAGNVWVINSNVGEWYMLNADGYFVSKLFQGDPLKVQFPDPAIPGASMDNAPCGMGGEDFGGSFCQGADGKLYIEAGKTADWDITVNGVKSIETLPGGSFVFTAADVHSALTLREQSLQGLSLGKQVAVNHLTPKFTGNLDGDFRGAQIISYQKNEDAAVRSAIAWDEKNVYLAWDVKDNTPWTNAATSADQMYIGGDTVDFQIGTDAAAPKTRTESAAGDLRVSIGNFQKNATAVLYRKISQEKKPMTFRSGTVANYAMDYVAPIADAIIQVHVIPGKGYIVEAAIPLKALGIIPMNDLHLRGDFGVTYGDPAGQRTRLRNFWSNQHTGIVDDAVYELMLEPRYWGDLVFSQ